MMPWLQRGGDQPQIVLGVDLAPALPSQDGQRVDQHDALHGGVEARVEEGVAAGERRACRLQDGGEQLMSVLLQEFWRSESDNGGATA